MCREVELTALLQYLANQLKGGESLDLLVLKEMVVTMTGTQVGGWVGVGLGGGGVSHCTSPHPSLCFAHLPQEGVM